MQYFKPKLFFGLDGFSETRQIILGKKEGFMSAICSIYTGNDELPLWTKYEEGEIQILESNYLVPIFWLACLLKIICSCGLILTEIVKI
jgi:hypothetical protein